MPNKSATTLIPRPPIVVVMGHIDHGKSTLLDYIRKTNVVETEAGGITQHLSAYEVVHSGEQGAERKITFLDTPGHEAFQKMRLRGAEIADVAILVVSAEEGVKAQTLEALNSIKEAGLPYVVAINKIDKPNANVERTKANLIENEIYLEGMGGDVPSVAVSAKAGTGIPELLDVLLLLADFKELTADPKAHARGLVIESNLDPRKGVSATLIIKDGVLSMGQAVVAGNALSPVRIFEDFQGKSIKEATVSSPVRIVGWDKLPEPGVIFESFDTKKEAEAARVESIVPPAATEAEAEEGMAVLPLILKADVGGSLDAIEHELDKIENERLRTKIISKGVGAVSENDIKLASGSEGALVIAFHTDVDRAARDLAERSDITIHSFDIIYKLAEWLAETIRARTPKEDVKEVSGRAKILKKFSQTKNKQVIGGRVEEGVLVVKKQFRILRQDTEIGHGTILNIQRQKADMNEAPAGDEFGAQLSSEIDIAPGDYIETYTTVRR